ncbi:ClbS/DfsB family four-helix bundle protein [Pseudomonas aeruginosa]
MSVPASKVELLTAICVNFDRLMIDLSKVPEERACNRSLEGHAVGTHMSPADLVSYLVGWNELVLKWLDQDDRGVKVDFPETGFKWNQLGLLAQKFYEDHHPISYPQLLDRLSKAKHRLVETISRRSNEELYGAPWYDKWTKGRMIQFNTSSPYANARGRIRKWLKAQDALTHSSAPSRN